MYYTNKQQLVKHKIAMEHKAKRNEINSEIKSGITKTVGYLGIGIVTLFFILILINL